MSAYLLASPGSGQGTLAPHGPPGPRIKYGEQLLTESGEPLVDFEAAFYATPGAATVLDLDGLILSANRAWCRTTMVAEADLVGKNLIEAYPFPDQETAHIGPTALKRAFDAAAEGMPCEMPVQRWPIKGLTGEFEVRFWKTIMVPIFSQHGHVSAVMCCTADVTDIMSIAEDRLAFEEMSRAQTAAIKSIGTAQKSTKQLLDEMKRISDRLSVGVA